MLGEIGPKVDAFSSVNHIASWAGLSQGSYESSGIKKAYRTTRGNKYLRKALVACAQKRLRIVYKLLKERIPYNAEKALGLRQQRLVHK
ncbi:transposase [Ruoffia tabacinasalis]|uniref:transposase n=1 Tax=Ruoffia tabacinasalis TaxID=87458 RepID=UPI003F9AA731